MLDRLELESNRTLQRTGMCARLRVRRVGHILDVLGIMRRRNANQDAHSQQRILHGYIPNEYVRYGHVPCALRIQHVE